MKFATSIILALAICGAHVQTRAEKNGKVPIPTFEPIPYTDPNLVPFVFEFYSINNFNRIVPDASCTTKSSVDACNAALEMFKNKNIKCDPEETDATRYFGCYPSDQVITAQTFVGDFNTLDNTVKEPCEMPKVPKIIEFAMEKGSPIEGKCWMKDIPSYEYVQEILSFIELSCEPHQQDDTLSCFARKSSPHEQMFGLFVRPKNMFKEMVFNVIPKINESTEKDHTNCVFGNSEGPPPHHP